MQGTYRILFDGKEVLKQNVITDAGRLGLLNVVAGKRNGFAESIVVGIGTTPAARTDVFLDFIVDYAAINASIVDSINEKIFFKASLPTEAHYSIYELGIYPGVFAGLPNQAGSTLNNFNSNSSWHDVTGTHQIFNTNSRLDATSLGYAIAAGQSAKGYVETSLDLLELPADTTFKFAYWTNNITNVKIRFKTDDSNYFEGAGFPVSNGYHISNILKSSFSAVGSPDWGNISIIEIESASTPGGQISFDGLRYDAKMDMTTGMLSRAVLSQPLIKPAGVSVDVEYQLDLDI